MTNPAEMPSTATTPETGLTVYGEESPEVKAVKDLEKALEKTKNNEELTKDEAEALAVASAVAEAADKVETKINETPELTGSDLTTDTAENKTSTNSRLFVAGSDMSMEGVKKAAGLPATNGRSVIFPRGINDSQTDTAEKAPTAPEVAETQTSTEPEKIIGYKTAAEMTADDDLAVGSVEGLRNQSPGQMVMVETDKPTEKPAEAPTDTRPEQPEPYFYGAPFFAPEEKKPAETTEKPAEASDDGEKSKDGHPEYVRGYDPKTGNYDSSAPVDAGDAYQGFFDEDEKPDDGKTKGKLDNGWEFEVGTTQDNPDKPKAAHPEYVQPGPVDEGDAYQGFEEDGKNPEKPEDKDKQPENPSLRRENEPEGPDNNPEKPVEEGGEKKPWEITAARSVDLTETLLAEAMRINAEKQEAAKFKNSRSIIKAIGSRIKNSTLFKNNTETLKAKELLDMCRDKAKNGNLSFEDWKAVLKANGIDPIPEQEAAFLGIVTANMEGLIKNKVEAPAEVKDKVKTACLEFATAIGAAGLSAEDREKLIAQHKEKISEIIRSNPDADPRDLELYADNAGEILNNVMATMEHDQSMAELDKQLSEMKIYIGELRYGPYNNIDTTQLEKVDRLGKKYNVASVIGKASFVVGTWLVTGGLSYALVNGAKSGSTIAASAALGALAGPVGALVGIGVGAVAAGLYGRHMGRRREIEKAQRFSSDVNAANRINFDRKGRKLIEPYLDKQGNIRKDLSPDELTKVEAIKADHLKLTTAEKLKPHQESMQDHISNLMRYMKPRDGLPEGWNKDDPRNYELRDDLSDAEKQAMAIDAAKLRELINYEEEYNKAAAGIASKANGRNFVTKAFSSSLNREGLALNLFSATTQASYLPQRFTMGVLLGYSEEALKSDAFKGLKVEIQDGAGNITMKPISEVMDLAAASTRTEADMNVADWHERVRKDINHTGRVSGGIAFGLALSIGLALKGGDILRDIKANGTTIPGNPVVKPVKITPKGNNTYSVETPAGAKTINVDPLTGKADPADIAALRQMGIRIDQKITPTTKVESSVAYIREKLGGIRERIHWLDNDTKIPNGTERTLHERILPNGSREYWTQGGTAHADGVSFDVLENNPVLRVSSEDGTTAIIATFKKSANGVWKAVVGANDPAMPVLNANAADVGITIVENVVKNGVSDRVLHSVATIAHPDRMVTATMFNTDLSGKLTVAGQAIARKISSWFATGVVNTPTKSGLDGIIDGSAGQTPDKKPEGGGEYHFGPGQVPGEKPTDKPSEQEPSGPTQPGPSPTGPTSPEGPNPPAGPTPPEGPIQPGSPVPPVSPVTTSEQPTAQPTAQPGVQPPVITPVGTSPEEQKKQEDARKAEYDKLASEYDTMIYNAGVADRMGMHDEAERARNNAQKIKNRMDGIKPPEPTTVEKPAETASSVENPEAFKAAQEERRNNADQVERYYWLKENSERTRDSDPDSSESFRIMADDIKGRLAEKGIKVDDEQKTENPAAPKQERFLSELTNGELEATYQDKTTNPIKKQAIAQELAKRDSIETDEGKAKRNPSNFVYGPMGVVRTNDGYVIKPKMTLNGLKYVVSRRHGEPSSEGEAPSTSETVEFKGLGDAKAYVLNEQNEEVRRRKLESVKAEKEKSEVSRLSNDQLVSRYKQLNEALGSIQAFGVDSEQSKKLREQTRPVLDELRRRGIITSEIA